MSTHRTSVGAAGEVAASRFLERRGATVVGRNVRVGRDEVDLVIRIGDELAVVEVKTGLGSGTRPWENYDEGKAARIRRAADALSIRRIDLIAVELKRDGVTIRWSPGAD